MSDAPDRTVTEKHHYRLLRSAVNELSKRYKEIERLKEIKDLAIKDCMAEAAENERLRAVVDAARGVKGIRYTGNTFGEIIGWNALQQALADLEKDDA